MEKSRAIELLEHLAWDRDIERNPYGDALNMAIEALKAQLSQESTAGQLNDGAQSTVQSTDLIDRQAAIDAVRASYDEILDFKSTGRTVADSVEDIISNLPSAEPDRMAPISYEEQLSLDCSFCREHECGDTLYESSSWDGGIGFDYIGDIRFCPICGRKLYGDE